MKKCAADTARSANLANVVAEGILSAGDVVLGGSKIFASIGLDVAHIILCTTISLRTATICVLATTMIPSNAYGRFVPLLYLLY